MKVHVPAARSHTDLTFSLMTLMGDGDGLIAASLRDVMPVMCDFITMVDHPLASYPLTLLKLIGKQEDAAKNPPLGISKRLGVETSAFNVAAHRLLKAVIEYSPSPATVAQEFLVELGKCGIPVVKEYGESFVLPPEQILFNGLSS
jgi:hypothetical protein